MPMLQNKSLSLVTRFMDRGEHLKRSLASWLLIPQVDEIIIVDFDSKRDNALTIVKEIQPYIPTELQIPVHVLQVYNQEVFNRGRAWNIGIHYAKSEFIFAVDCDVILKNNPLNTILLDKFTLWRSTDKWTSLCGTCIFSRDLWYQVGGYAEFQEGWGHDDDYFHGKLYPLGVHTEFMNFDCFEHQEHDLENSVQYHKIKDRWESRDLNVATASLIRKVYFDTVLVGVTTPDGKTRDFNFPVQVIDKKEPTKMMEEIYKTGEVPPELQHHVNMMRHNRPSNDENRHGEKSSFMPILSFPRPQRL
jgi:glycosyltransferase involved in cell wall biosynthesis